MSNYESEIDEINQKLQQVQDRQIQNKQDLNDHEQMENIFSETNVQGQRLFDRINKVWHRDEDLGMQMEQCQIEVNRHEQKILHELEAKKQELLGEKRDLYDVEDELSVRRFTLSQEEKA